MNPLALLLILVTAGTPAVYGGHSAAAGTPAARFWEEALPGSPMPEAIADLVQEGIDHSPLVEHYSDNLDANKLPTTSAINIFYRISYNKQLRRGSSKATVPPGIFFQEAQVRVGSTMTTSFAQAAVAPILQRVVAQKVPFSNLADVLATFNIKPSSVEAATVGETLRLCEAPPPAGEQRACTMSLEGTVLSATRMIGGATHGVYWAASSALPRAGLPLQAYVVQAVTPLAGDRHVGCHSLPYPYAVYYCHMTGRPSKAYAVSLRGLHGALPPVTMAAICHLDTSDWDPAHPAFKMLHTQPGGAPVCHFMSYASLLFGEKAANA